MKRFFLSIAAFLVSVNALAFDHGYRAWDELLKKADIAFLDYDWSLNDVKSSQ